VVKDLLREGRPCLTFYPPKWNSDDTAKDYLSGQIEDLSEELRRMGLPMAEGALEEALSWGARRTALLNELYDLRASGSLAAGNAAFYQAVRSREYLWPEDASKRLGEFILEKRGRRADGATPLVFSGILPQPRDLMAQLDDLGVAVVEDDVILYSEVEERMAAVADDWSSATTAWTNWTASWRTSAEPRHARGHTQARCFNADGRTMVTPQA
jgi:hypothetical protein